MRSPNRYIRLSDTVDASNVGIFDALLRTNYDIDWLDQTNAALLDEQYYMLHSGDRIVSPIIEKYIATHTGADPEKLTAAEWLQLAHHVLIRYGAKWSEIWNLMEIEFDPIENYNMEEIDKPDLKHKHQVSQDYALTDTSSANTKTTSSSNVTGETDTYGFNSDVAVPAAGTYGNSSASNMGLAADNVETNTHTQAGYTEDVESGKRVLTRHGNIGVTTSQQMAQSHIDLWERYGEYIQNIFHDIDRILALSIW